MPFNLKQNDTAEFNVQFIDPFGVSYTPTTATLTLVYTVGGVSNSSVISLTEVGGFWEGNWVSSLSGVDVPSLVTWTVASSCGAGDVGTIRMIDP